jgi:60 kDa SS-A/Ro ribonucleoprotein
MMAKNDPLTSVSTRRTPQTSPSDRATTRNSAGGYVFATGDDVQIQRFLVLGTTGGTYYTGQAELTKENAALVLEAARTRGRWLADQAAEVSIAGRAPRQGPALFALAAVAGLGDDDARAYALGRLPEVARTASTLFTWLNYVGQFRGWGPGLVKAVQRWYLGRDAESLAYQLVKYRQRDGWTHRDVLRQAHPKAEAGSVHDRLFAWVTRTGSAAGGEFDPSWSALPELVEAFERAQRATDPKVWRELAGGDARLPWEAYPDAALADPKVWAALMLNGRVPAGAMLRQLPRLTRLGVLQGDVLRVVHETLADAETLKRARIHPVNVLVAQKTYASGQGRGSSWTPIRAVSDVLDAGFYAAFGAVRPSGGRTLVALDVSGSMGWHAIGGMPLTAREGSAAMALVTLATEPAADVVGFTAGRGSRLGSNGVSELDVTPRRRLDDVVRYVSGLDFGRTDCALPMLWATARGQGYDHFVIYTDNETWAGSVHPHQALREHREKLNPSARLTVAGMTSTGFSIADPADPGQLDVVGFDSAAPQLIADFGGGRL